MKARLPKSGIDNLLRTYPEAKRFVDIATELGITESVEQVVSILPVSAGLCFLTAWMIYPAISRDGAEAVTKYPEKDVLPDYWAAVRLHYCLLGDEYMYKLLQVYTGIDEARDDLLTIAADSTLTDKQVFERVAEKLTMLEMQHNIALNNDDTLLSITEFDNPNSELYIWCRH